MTIPFVDLNAQLSEIRGEILSAVEDAVNDGQYILGDQVASFEQSFAEFSGAQHGIGVGNGTEALHLALGRSASGRATKSSRPPTRSSPRRSRSPTRGRRRYWSTSIRRII